MAKTRFKSADQERPHEQAGNEPASESLREVSHATVVPTWRLTSIERGDVLPRVTELVFFVVTAADPYTIVDLDSCRDPKTGAMTPEARAAVDALASYSEVSVSGTGVHIIVRGALPPRGRKTVDIEMYDAARFMSMSGYWLGLARPRESRRSRTR
jgi:hypothetical protein